jgi:membrane protein implicated in regulation of membrane protease activity
MIDVFVLSLVVGGGLLAVSSIAGDGGDADLDVDLDVDGDSDALRIVSIRSLTYFAFGFGAVGTGLRYLAGGGGISLYIAAIVGGLLMASMSEMVFRYLERTDSGQMESESALIGQLGVMSLPIGRGGAGKVAVARGGRVHTLIARPIEGAVGDPSEWREVVIVEMQSGEARVSPA